MGLKKAEKKVTVWKVWEFDKRYKVFEKNHNFYKPQSWLKSEYNGRWQQISNRVEYEIEIEPRPVFWDSVIEYFKSIIFFIDDILQYFDGIIWETWNVFLEKKPKKVVDNKAHRVSKKMKAKKRSQWIIERATKKKERLWGPAIIYAGIILAVYFHLRPVEFVIEVLGTFVVFILILTIIYCWIDLSREDSEREIVRDIETGGVIAGEFIGEIIEGMNKENLN